MAQKLIKNYHYDNKELSHCNKISSFMSETNVIIKANVLMSFSTLRVFDDIDYSTFILRKKWYLKQKIYSYKILIYIHISYI